MKKLAAIAISLLMLALLVFSESAMNGALTAAHSFVTGVLPALFPMMVLGKLLPNHTKSEHSGFLSRLRTVLFSFAAGSPAAAQRAADLHASLSARQWECLLCLTGVMSPMFFTGTLAGWLDSARDGWILMLLHWAGAAAAAVCWRLTARGGTHAPAAEPACEPKPSLPEAIAQSAQSLLCVCGAMMIFSVLASLIRSLLEAFFPLWTAQHAGWLAVFWALMEIGGGSRAVISAFPQPQALLSALCGFGGLSILLQNMLFLGKRIRPAKLLLMRALHGAVCYALVRILRPF